MIKLFLSLVIFMSCALTHISAKESILSIAFSTDQDMALEACVADSISKSIQCSIDQCISTKPENVCELDKVCSPTGWSAIVEINSGVSIKKSIICGLTDKNIIVLKAKRICLNLYKKYNKNNLYTCKIIKLWNSKGELLEPEYQFDAKIEDLSDSNSTNTECTITPNSIAGIKLGMPLSYIHTILPHATIKKTGNNNSDSPTGYIVYLNKNNNKENITVVGSHTNRVIRITTNNPICKTLLGVTPNTLISNAKSLHGGFKNIEYHGNSGRYLAHFNNQSKNINYYASGGYNFKNCGQFGDCRTLSSIPDKSRYTQEYIADAKIKKIMIFDQEINAKESSKYSNRKKCLITDDSIAGIKLDSSIDNLYTAFPNAKISGIGSLSGTSYFNISAYGSTQLMASSNDHKHITTLRSYNSKCKTENNLGAGTQLTTAIQTLGSIQEIRLQPIEGAQFKSRGGRFKNTGEEIQPYAIFKKLSSTIKFGLNHKFDNGIPNQKTISKAKIKSVTVHKSVNINGKVESKPEISNITDFSCIITNNSIAGVRLGMTYNEIKKAIPDAEIEFSVGAHWPSAMSVKLGEEVLMMAWSKSLASIYTRNNQTSLNLDEQITHIRTFSDKCKMTNNIGPGTLVSNAATVFNGIDYIEVQNEVSYKGIYFNNYPKNMKFEISGNKIRKKKSHYLTNEFSAETKIYSITLNQHKQSGTDIECLITPKSIAGISLGMKLEDIKNVIPNSEITIKNDENKKTAIINAIKPRINIIASSGNDSIITTIKTNSNKCKTEKRIGPGTYISHAEVKLKGIKKVTDIAKNGIRIKGKQYIYFNKQPKTIKYKTKNSEIIKNNQRNSYSYKSNSTISNIVVVDKEISTSKSNDEKEKWWEDLWSNNIDNNTHAIQRIDIDCQITNNAIAGITLDSNIDDIVKTLPNSKIENYEEDAFKKIEVINNHKTLMLAYYDNDKNIYYLETNHPSCKLDKSIKPGSTFELESDYLGGIHSITRVFCMDGIVARTEPCDRKQGGLMKYSQFIKFNIPQKNITIAVASYRSWGYNQGEMKLPYYTPKILEIGVGRRPYATEGGVM